MITRFGSTDPIVEKTITDAESNLVGVLARQVAKPIVCGLPLLRAENIPAMPKGFKVVENALPVIIENATGAEQFVAFDKPPRLVPIIRRWMHTTQCNFNRAIQLT